jgi:hypothetical protein
VLNTQQAVVFLYGTEPWFGRIFRISFMRKSDFGHSGPLCVHVDFHLALSNGLPPKAGLSRELQRATSRVHNTS